jgi:N-acetylneuraminate synthase/N,N'-diacetyllegionaminate synthase
VGSAGAGLQAAGRRSREIRKFWPVSHENQSFSWTVLCFVFNGTLLDPSPGDCDTYGMVEPQESAPWSGAHGPLLIAEIGGNHEGDFGYAKRLTELAISSGADAVKFQLYRGATLVNALESPDRHAHFKRFELTRDQHLELARMCEASGVAYLASVWDLEMLEWIDPHLTVYKIGSGDLTAFPILRAFAQRGKPMIVSTGLSTLDEVLAAVKFIQSVNPAYADARMLALLQCTSMYPIDDGDANLRVMDSLRAATGLAVGYSDHTRGRMALFVAAARGADVLEFHFTDNRAGKTFRDHQVSLTADEVRTLCADLDQLRALLGDGVKRPLPSEVDTGHVTSVRRAVYCRHAIAEGQIISADDLVVLRPNHGVDARQFDALVGKRAARALQPLERVEVA